jgi:hypothetical protein
MDIKVTPVQRRRFMDLYWGRRGENLKEMFRSWTCSSMTMATKYP